MDNKLSTSIRLTPEAKRLLSKLARKLGISQAGVIEIAIRKLATSEGVQHEDRND